MNYLNPEEFKLQILVHSNDICDVPHYLFETSSFLCSFSRKYLANIKQLTFALIVFHPFGNNNVPKHH